MSELITKGDAKQILEDYWEHKYGWRILASEMTTLFFKVDALELITYVWERCYKDTKNNG